MSLSPPIVACQAWGFITIAAQAQAPPVWGTQDQLSLFSSLNNAISDKWFLVNSLHIPLRKLTE